MSVLSSLDAGTVWRFGALRSFAERATALGLLSSPEVQSALQAIEDETNALEDLSNQERRGERQPRWWEAREQTRHGRLRAPP
jgi:hypothetical protein